jgi:2-polyprenyl-6-methoxyphenol hydroxylase-like FAD-dependent oxidoreductase
VHGGAPYNREMSAHDVLVRGAGAVGLAAALSLARQGLRVALLADQAKMGSQPDVRAYALNAASVSLLQQLKVWEAMAPDARTPVYDMHIEGDALGASLDFSAWSQGLSELAWIVDAAELERALHAAADFAPHLQRVATAVPAPLVVLAEGKDSASREQLGVHVSRHAYGHRAVAARLTTNQGHAGLARQWFRSPDILALLPLDRPQAGHGYGLVWSVPNEQADHLMALPHLEFERALMDATAGAAGDLVLCSPRAHWPLSLAQAEAVHGAGWVLVGDAAHVVHPLAGQGLNLGLADVQALAEELQARESWRALGDPKLGERYARRRRAPTQAMTGLTDALWHLFAHPAPLTKELRNRGLSLLNQLPPLKRLLTSRALGG